MLERARKEESQKNEEERDMRKVYSGVFLPEYLGCNQTQWVIRQRTLYPAVGCESSKQQKYLGDITIGERPLSKAVLYTINLLSHVRSNSPHENSTSFTYEAYRLMTTKKSATLRE